MTRSAPLRGFYEFGEAGSRVDVHDGPADIDSHHSPRAQVWMVLDCELSLQWNAEGLSVPLGPVTIQVDRPGLGPVAVPVSATHSSGRGYIASASLDAGRDLDHVIAHWINLPAIRPSEALSDAHTTWQGRWPCEAAGWRLVLDSRPSLETELSEIGMGRKFVMTHVSRLSRIDGKQFQHHEAADALYGFQLALSFALGRWVAPALPVGVDSDGNVAWEQWAAWRCDNFSGFRGWWDTHTSVDLELYVRLFMDHWCDPTRRDVVRHSVHHAIAANHASTTLEARVMLAQAGLEYLSWVKYVLSKRIGKKKYKQGSAETHVRRLLADSGISPTVPVELPALHQLAKVQGLDGPHAVTWMRNRLVHPKDANEPYRIEGVLVDAWQLVLNYLELAVLHHLGYVGEYVPRFPPGRFAHDRVRVPWA